jgi:O-antigen ligase
MMSALRFKTAMIDPVLVFTGLFAFLIPIHRTASIIALGLAIGLFLIKKQYRKQSTQPYAYLLAPSLLFILYLLSALLQYTPDTNWLSIEKKILLFVFPLFIYFNTLTKAQLRQLLAFFTAGCFIFTLIAIGKAILFYNAPTEHFTLRHLPHQLSADLHAPYLSLLLTLANFCILFLLSQQKGSRQGYLAGLLLVVYFTGFLLILSSRTALVLNFLVLFIFLYYWSQAQQQKRIFYGVTGVGLLGLVVLFVSYPHLQERFAAVFRGSGEGVSERMMITRAAFRLLGDYPITGVGTQHMQEALVRQYQILDYPSAIEKLNPHNEYLFSGLAMGVGGMLVMILMLALPIYECVRRKQMLLMIPFCIFALAFLTEVLLERYWGVAVFVFFYTIFVRILSDTSLTHRNLVFHQTKFSSAN